MIRPAQDTNGHGLITAVWPLSDCREYWHCEGPMGAASRPGIGGLQCQRVSYRAAGLIPNVERRRSADAVTFYECSSAKHHPDAQGDEDT